MLAQMPRIIRRRRAFMAAAFPAHSGMLSFALRRNRRPGRLPARRESRGTFRRSGRHGPIARIQLHCVEAQCLCRRRQRSQHPGGVRNGLIRRYQRGTALRARLWCVARGLRVHYAGVTRPARQRYDPGGSDRGLRIHMRLRPVRSIRFRLHVLFLEYSPAAIVFDDHPTRLSAKAGNCDLNIRHDPEHKRPCVRSDQFALSRLTSI